MLLFAWLPLLVVQPASTGTPAELARIAARVESICSGPDFDRWVDIFRRSAIGPNGWERPTGAHLQSIAHTPCSDPSAAGMSRSTEEPNTAVSGLARTPNS